jgi:hypothetical protein
LVRSCAGAAGIAAGAAAGFGASGIAIFGANGAGAGPVVFVAAFAVATKAKANAALANIRMFIADAPIPEGKVRRRSGFANGLRLPESQDSP